MLTCDAISYSRSGIPLFSELSLTLMEGALLYVRGVNGSGKSTLLRLLAGFDRPDSGKILWQGKPVEENDDYRRQLLYIGHRNGVNPRLTVRENLELWAKLHQEWTLLAAAMEYFELTPLEDMPCHMLSAGWKRKVALARLILIPAKIWLLDEPSSNLDHDSAMLMLSLAEIRAKRGGIVVIATHDEMELSSAMRIDLGEYVGGDLPGISIGEEEFSDEGWE